MSTMVMCQENGSTPAMFQRYPSPPVNTGFSGFGYGYPGSQHPQDYQFPSMTDPNAQQAWYNAMYGGRADEWTYGTPTSSASPPGMSPYQYRPGTMGIDYSQTAQGVMTSQTMESPGNTSSSSSNAGSPSNKQLRPPYDWMKKAAYQGAPIAGKTRTKDKYRVVYSDHQRLELEKEFHYSRYITIRRKAELAQTLALSERQVKIWFQNRRAKERKQNKKREETNGLIKVGDISSELADEDKQQLHQQMNLQMNAHAQHHIRLQTPSPSATHAQPQYQTSCHGLSLQNDVSPANTISPNNSMSPDHLFSPQGHLSLAVSPIAHTSPPTCSATPPITIKTDLDAQDTMTSCV